MKKVLLLGALIAIVAACATQGDQTQTKKDEVPHDSITVINGVERSELALLMRKMYDEMALVKDSLKEGHTVRTHFLEEFKRIQHAHATEPEKIDETYQALAEAFLFTYEQFEVSQEKQVEAFNQMLQNCLVCHENKCPGPVKSIKKLRVKPTGNVNQG